MDEITKQIIKSYVAQAMLVFALDRIEGKNTDVDTIAQEYTDKIIEELK